MELDKKDIQLLEILEKNSKSPVQELSDKTGIPVDQYYNLIKHVKDRPGHDIRYSCVNNKIMSEIGWQPKKNFTERLEYTVDWYLSSNEWIQRVIDADSEKHYS